MTTRVLNPAEWARVPPDTGLTKLLPYCEPENTDVVVVEDENGEIVAAVCALRVTHFEGLWLEPKHRGNAGTFRALIKQAYEIPRSRGEKFVFGGAKDSQMSTLCTRLGGGEVAMKLYALPVVR